MRRRMAATGLAALLMATAVPIAHAGEEWCPWDPTVVISTPAGKNVVVHVTNSAFGAQHLPALKAATITQTVAAAPDGGATDVTLDVLIPNDSFASGFPVRSVASSGPAAAPGTIYAAASGKSGKAMRLKFRLNVP